MAANQMILVNNRTGGRLPFAEQITGIGWCFKDLSDAETGSLDARLLAYDTDMMPPLPSAARVSFCRGRSSLDQRGRNHARIGTYLGTAWNRGGGSRCASQLDLGLRRRGRRE